MLSTDFHKNLSAFVILTSEVGLKGFRLEKEIGIEPLNCMLKESSERPSWHAKKPICPSFLIEKESEQSYLVLAKVNLELFYPCVRCLEEVQHDFNFDFKIRMLPGKKLSLDELTEFSDEKFFSTDDLNSEDSALAVGYFSDQKIDLALILREQIFLELPDYPSCKSDKMINSNPCRMDFIDISDSEFKLQNPFVKFFNKQL